MAERAVDSLPMPGAYFRLLLRRYGEDPAQAARIAAGTGIDPAAALAAGPDDEILLGQQLRQVANLAGLLEPGWGLQIGRSLDAAAQGALGVAAVSAPSLAEALSVLERFAHVRVPFFRLEPQAGTRHFTLAVKPQLRLEPLVWQPLTEALLHSIQALVESALGRPMGGAHCEVDYPAPSYADHYTDSLHAPVVFGQPQAAVRLPVEWLPMPCPFADPALHRSAVERLEAAERRLQGEEYIVAQVERILEGAGDAGLDLIQVASQLHLSRRTLVRRLGRRGTSFRELLDGHRHRRARELLADPSLSVAEIGYRLGYTEPGNFGRACRRWFGAGPRTVRERLGAG
jgi:AraC-like DNA-binding protein